MKFYKELPINATVVDHSTGINITLCTDHAVSGDFALLLVMLKEGLAERLKIGLADFTIYLDMTQNTYTTYTALDTEKKVLHASVSPDMLGYWLGFLLIYYRDNGSPVDHVDLEFLKVESPGLTITHKLLL